MSLVGTRPPTVDEWELYEPHHRARMSFRPGLTGMWQVSGRSQALKVYLKSFYPKMIVGWDAVLDTNLKGMFFMTQAVSNYMIQNKIKGHILNVSSAGALKPGYTPYEISKSGVASFTKGAAAELITLGLLFEGVIPNA